LDNYIPGVLALNQINFRPANTYRGSILFDSGNNLTVTSSMGQINLYPNGATALSNLAYGLRLSSSGLCTLGNQSTYKYCESTPALIGNVNVQKPLLNAVTSATGGSGTGTVTCITAACTNLSGTYSVAGGTFATGNLLTLAWPTTTTAYNCWTSQNGGVATYGIGHAAATATGMTITSGITIAGVTVKIDYGCSAN